MDKYYFDTGIFVTPLLKNRGPGLIEKCIGWLQKAAKGEIIAYTSFITWEEVAWVAGKRARGGSCDPKAALEAGNLLLRLSGLRFISVESRVVSLATDLLGCMGWRPYDCIHAASALLEASRRLVTIDTELASNLKAANAAGLRFVFLEDT